jgi:hypothetical protein
MDLFIRSRMSFTIEVIFLDCLLHVSQNVEDGRRESHQKIFPRVILDKETRVSELEGERSLETFLPIRIKCFPGTAHPVTGEGRRLNEKSSRAINPGTPRGSAAGIPVVTKL